MLNLEILITAALGLLVILGPAVVYIVTRSASQGGGGGPGFRMRD
jgi:threonine/homoserine/homoserine lactone efflux protein